MAGLGAHRPPPGGRSAIHFQGVTSRFTAGVGPSSMIA
jgi:hypothetical protein